MIIYQKKSSIRQLILNFFSQKNQTFLLLPLFLAVLCLGLTGLVFIFGKSKISALVTNNKIKIREFTSTNYYRFKNPNPEHMSLDIPFENFQKIMTKRDEALQAGILLASDDDFVKATLNYEGGSIPIELRLKGDWTDHLEGNKWSFRIKVKGSHAFKGMKYFSIQDPKTRFFANEWLFYKALKQENFIALRYDFIDVSINGENIGTYAIEEHFSKELIENNQRREGPILKFSEDRVWSNNLRYEFLEDSEDGQAYRSEIQAFKTDKILADNTLAQEFAEAERLLDGYRQGNVKAEQVFDLDQWAKLYALGDVFNVEHGLTTHNLRYYYNPITGLIEPVAFDQMIEKRIAQLRVETDTVFSDFPSLYENKEFMAKYLGYLETYSQTEFLDSLLEKNRDELKEVEAMINRDEYYRFSPTFFYINQDFIRKKITDTPAVRASFTEEKNIVFNALTELPVEILAVFNEKNEKIADFTENPLFIPAANKTSTPEKISIPTPENASSTQLENYTASYRFLGLKKEHTIPFSRWILSTQDKRFTSESPVPNFVSYDPKTKTYYLKKGNWQLKNDWVIPPLKKLVIEPGASLDIVNSSAIISHGPVFISGNSEEKIRIFSSDTTGQGILVLKAHDLSEISNTLFENLRNISSPSNNITGSVTFFQSPVKIDRVVFSNNMSEDMLNIIDSEFTVDNSSFLNSFADGLDVDFGTGTISNTRFNQLTNDAIDVSGSEIEISNVEISGAQDKGVSAGEKSRVEVKNSHIENSNLAFASKDQSELTIHLSTVKNTRLAFAIYQKKPEFGPARMVVWNTILNDVSRENLIEEHSVLTLNGNDYFDDEENVYQQLLDNVQN